MDSGRCEDSGEMYPPDDQGEYLVADEAPQFLVQGLSDTLSEAGRGMEETPVEEYAMLLEVMMADISGQPHPPRFSWNAGMVMHILKSDPALRELEHMQVDRPGIAFLFFYDKQGCHSLGQDTAYALRTHVEEAFVEWISCSAHFTISLISLGEVWWQAVVASHHCRSQSRSEIPVPNIPVVTMGESDSSGQLMGSAPQHVGRTHTEGGAESRPAQHGTQLHGRLPKSQGALVGGGGLPPSSPERGAPDSNGYSTASEFTGRQH